MVSEIRKGEVYRLVSLVDHASSSVVSRAIFQKATGDITLLAAQNGQEFSVKTPPFETFVVVLAGSVHYKIGNKACILETGDCMIIPAHHSYEFTAKGDSKILSVTIKSGYED